MSQLIGIDLGDYIFNPATRQVCFLQCPPILLGQIGCITDKTAGVIIYDGAQAGFGGVMDVLNNVLTLEYDTSSLNAADRLEIIVHLTVQQAPEPPQETRNKLQEAFLDHIDALLDPYNETATGEVTLAPDVFRGAQPEIRSIPVALPPEQVVDTTMQGFNFGAGYLGHNVLVPTANPSVISPWLDVSRWGSIFIEIETLGATTGAITFETTNDPGQAPLAMQMWDLAAPGTLPVTNFTLASNTVRYWGGPTTFKYFRARVSTILAGGTLTAFTTLRRAPFVPIQNYIANITAGVAGTLAVGGNVADGTTTTLQPVLAGGQAPTGAQSIQAATATIPAFPVIAAGQTKKGLTDTLGNGGVTSVMDMTALRKPLGGPVTVSGIRWGYSSGDFQPVKVALDTSALIDGMSIQDLLAEILLQFKVNNYYLQIWAGVNDTPADVAQLVQ